MTKVAVISTNDSVYGVNKSLELLNINPVKGKNVIFKPNFNTADPPPASSSMETVKQLVLKLKEMGAESITLAERAGPAKTSEVFEKVGLNALAKDLGFKIVDLTDVSKDEYIYKKLINKVYKGWIIMNNIY